MIKVYSYHVECDTFDEAIQAQAIITNAMCYIPKICNDRGMFLVPHELEEDILRELLNQEEGL